MYKKDEIKEIFLSFPERELHIREIANKLGINPMTARKYLIELKKEDYILEVPSKLRVKNYRLNIDSHTVKEERKHSIIRKIYGSGLVEYLNKELNYPAIILFGSAAKGEDTKESDLDIFVYSETRKELKLDRYEDKIGKKVQIFRMNQKEFNQNKAKNKHLINNILNGVVISGFIEVFR